MLRTNIRHTIVNGKYTLPVVVIIYLLSFFLFRNNVSAVYDGGMLWHILRDSFPALLTSRWVTLALHALAVYTVLELDAVFALIRVRTTFQISTLMLLLASFPTLFNVGPASIAALFVFASFFPLFFSYQKHDAPVQMFYSGLLFSLATMFVPKILWFMPLYFIFIVSIGSGSLRNMIAYIWGISIFYMIVAGLCYYFGAMPLFVTMVRDIFSVESISYESLGIDALINISVLSFLILTSVVHFAYTSFKDKIRTRIFLYIISWISLIVMFLILILPSEANELLTLSFAFISILASHTFCLVDSRSGSVFFGIFMLLLICVLGYNIYCLC